LLQAVFPDTGEELLVQIECQTEKDPIMPERLLEYHLRARLEHKRPVYSCVIYLLEDGNVQQSPLRWEIPGGQEILQFHYQVIEVRKMTPGEFRQLGLPGIQPFMILTKGGATREIADEIFTSLERAGKIDSSAAAYNLVSLAFGKDRVVDQEWLTWRFKMHEILRETPFYQEMTREAREEGLEKGLEKGMQKGRLQTLRDILFNFVQTRFPDPKLTHLAQSQIAIIDDPEVLENLILKVGPAQTAEEVQHYLLDWRDNVEQED